MNIIIYTHTYIYVYIYTHTHIYVYIYTHINIYILMEIILGIEYKTIPLVPLSIENN